MDNELKTNAVTLNPDEQYQIRKSIVRLNKAGKSNKDIAEILDVSEKHVRNVKKVYAELGIVGIKPKKRGRKKGEERSLAPEQERDIAVLLSVDPLLHRKRLETWRFLSRKWTTETTNAIFKKP
jgi:transposase